MPDKLSIKKYMAKDLVKLSPDMSILQAIDILLKNRISGAPVVDSQMNLLGILSEKDCLNVIIDSRYYDRPFTREKVGEFMTKQVKTLSDNKSILDAAYEFSHSTYKRFPVMDGDKIIGQISRRDVLKAVKDIQPEVKLTPSSWINHAPMEPPSKTGHHEPD